MVKEIMPVIHVLNEKQVFDNIEICVNNGINKIWLIDHLNNTWTELNDILINVKNNFPNLWVGVNYLQLTSYMASLIVSEGKTNPNGLWCDNSHLNDINDVSIAISIKKNLKNTGVTYFGGVEFKYQQKPKNEDISCIHEHASNLIDVITTSGPGTGKQINIDKLKRMRDNVGNDKLIAVASGVNAENKNNILELANFLMVASSITEAGTEMIVPDKLKKLIEI